MSTRAVGLIALILIAGTVRAEDPPPRRVVDLVLEGDSPSRVREVGTDRTFELDDPRLPRLVEMARSSRARQVVFRADAEDRGTSLAWLDFIDMSEDGVAIRRLDRPWAEAVRETTVALPHGGRVRIPRGRPIRVLNHYDHLLEVELRGPANSLAIGRLPAADARPIPTPASVRDWPALETAPGQAMPALKLAGVATLRVVKGRADLLDPDLKRAFRLLEGTPVTVLGVRETPMEDAGYPYLWVAVAGQAGWLEGFVHHAALDDPAPATEPVRGIGDAIAGVAREGPEPALPIPSPGPLVIELRGGVERLVHGGRSSVPYRGPVAVTARGVVLFEREGRRLVDGIERPHSVATHGEVRWVLTDQGYTLDLASDEIVLPGGRRARCVTTRHGGSLRW